jgi:transcriptional regulator with XRE-family HTH domain
METVFDRIEILVDYLIDNHEVKSVNAFSLKIGLSRNATTNLLNSRKTLPSFPFLEKIGKAFGVNMNWLIFGQGEMFICDNDIKKTQEENERLKAENNLLLSELQGSRFALSIVAKHSNLQQGNVAANFKVVSKKSPVNQQLIIKKTIVVNSLVNSVS